MLVSPGYHGTVSGLVKNALDYIEDLRDDPRPYLDGRAVGCVATASGWQAAVTTLTSLRSIVHALRGWPTPLGAAVNSAQVEFTADGGCTDEKVDGLASHDRATGGGFRHSARVRGTEPGTRSVEMSGRRFSMSKSPITSPLGDAERESTGAVLQATLVDLIDLSLIAKQAHWNVVGPNFRSAHLQLDELVDAARQYVDDVAERANAIGISPNGKARTVWRAPACRTIPDNWQSVESTVAAIVNILGEMIKRLRKRIDETDKSDLVTQDLLIEIAQELEKQHWMWQAQTAKI